MKNLLINIDNTISEFNNQVNNNFKGINYLERLKFYLIDNFKKNFDFDFPNDISIEEKVSKENKDNNLLIKLKLSKESESKLKYKTNHDSLSIILDGSKSIDIYENLDLDTSHLIVISKFMGVSLPQDTYITEKISKDSLILDIINYKEDINIIK
jgi:hypothetical protein